MQGGVRMYQLPLAATLIFASASGNYALAAAEAPLAQAAVIDACSLLSSSEIEHALQLPVQKPERNDAGDVADGAYSSVCVWKITAPDNDEVSQEDADAPLGGRHFVILNAMAWPAGKAMARKYLDAFYAAAERGDIPHQPVPRKLGDDALWWGDGLAVRKGDVSFGVSVFVPGMSVEHAAQMEEFLAKQILLKIGGETSRPR